MRITSIVLLFLSICVFEHKAYAQACDPNEITSGLPWCFTDPGVAAGARDSIVKGKTCGSVGYIQLGFQICQSHNGKALDGGKNCPPQLWLDIANKTPIIPTDPALNCGSLPGIGVPANPRGGQCVTTSGTCSVSSGPIGGSCSCNGVPGTIR